MKKNLYCYYDDVACSFGHPFLEHNDKCAVRDFVVACKNISPTSIVRAEDFKLYKLGSYDEDTGIIVSTVSYVCSYNNSSDLLSGDILVDGDSDEK